MLTELRRIVESMAEANTLEQALQALVSQTRLAMTVDCCSVYVAEPEMRRYRLAATDGLAESAVGKARFMDNPQVAALKVSFFGPFHGGFNVVALDPEYRWALVIGSSVDSCWILSRTPDLPEPVATRLLRQAAQAGVQVDRLTWVHQDGVSW